jgi:GMP synthase (glutamine-hydrolysing)
MMGAQAVSSRQVGHNPKPILMITHHDATDVGVVGQLLNHWSVPFQICEPYAGHDIPDPTECAGAVIFGGAMSANDDHTDFIAAEFDWVKRALDVELPLLGLCLGAQLVARALGAEVCNREDEMWEIGYRTLEPTQAGAQWFRSQQTFFEWHGEGFELPEGAVRLAGTQLYPQQAFRYGENTFGFQFHPEVSAQSLHQWQTHHAQDMRYLGGDSIETQRREDPIHRPGIEAWLVDFLGDWIAKAGVTPRV